MQSSLFEKLASSWHDVLHEAPTPRQVEQFDRYRTLIQQWNERINLTAIVDDEGIVTRHFLDSLSLLAVLPATPPLPYSLIDVGSGAGFPGMALAVMRPTWQITLLDSTRKKVDFLALVAQELELDNVTTAWGRAEEAGRDPAHRGQYDVALARAVAELRVLAEYCLPFVRVGGHWVAQKGPRVEEELTHARNALGQLGGALVTVRQVPVPGLADETRTLVVVQKRKATPATFPRRPGTPSKRPL